jgi:3-deoxy-7-phosphoheptulonate synthase
MSPSSATTENMLGDQKAKDEWSPSSWRKKTAKQQPVYVDTNAHQNALEKLETLPPLVTVPEVPIPSDAIDEQIRRLREELKKVALNQKFLLHGGDCAEAFAYSSKVHNRFFVLMAGSN